MNRLPPQGKLPKSWNVGGLRLVGANVDPLDPRDTREDSPARITERDLEKLERLRDTPVFKGCDALWEEYMVLPVIHVRVLTDDRERTRAELMAHLVVHVGGVHIDGFDPLFAVGPDIQVV